MPHDSGQMMHGVSLHVLVPVFLFVFFASIAVGMSVLLARRVSGGQLPIARLASAGRVPALRALKPISNSASERDELHDTIFVLPDISHYTQFMTGTQFSHAHAQHIIFSLINAMIEAATKTVNLSKLEGDAAMFFVDANRVTDSSLSKCLMHIFRAFYTERQNLISSNICPCQSCRHIGAFELKIFVHRGNAARFSFRGAIDHFGTDVIVLHRIMKNSVDADRYVMVTEGAMSSVEMPQMSKSYAIHEERRGYWRSPGHGIRDR